MSNKLKTISHMSHGEGDHITGHAVKGVLGRDGAPKKLTPIAYHDGMSPLQKDGAGIGGMGHPTAVIDGGQTIASSAAAAPLASAYGAAPDLKSGTPAAPPYPGQRSQTNQDNETHADKVQHGQDTLATAVYSGGKT